LKCHVTDDIGEDNPYYLNFFNFLRNNVKYISTSTADNLSDGFFSLHLLHK